MISRVAQSCFWLSRYLERVESIDTLAGDLEDVLVLRAGKKRFRSVRLVRES